MKLVAFLYIKAYRWNWWLFIY